MFWITVNPPKEPALKYNPPSNTTLTKALILLSKILPSKSSYGNRTRGCTGGFTVFSLASIDSQANTVEYFFKIRINSVPFSNKPKPF